MSLYVTKRTIRKDAPVASGPQLVATMYYYGLGGENDLSSLTKYAIIYARDTMKCDLFVMHQS